MVAVAASEHHTFTCGEEREGKRNNADCTKKNCDSLSLLFLFFSLQLCRTAALFDVGNGSVCVFPREGD